MGFCLLSCCVTLFLDRYCTNICLTQIGSGDRLKSKLASRWVYWCYLQEYEWGAFAGAWTTQRLTWHWKAHLHTGHSSAPRNWNPDCQCDFQAAPTISSWQFRGGAPPPSFWPSSFLSRSCLLLRWLGEEPLVYLANFWASWSLEEEPCRMEIAAWTS